MRRSVISALLSPLRYYISGVFYDSEIYGPCRKIHNLFRRSSFAGARRISIFSLSRINADGYRLSLILEKRQQKKKDCRKNKKRKKQEERKRKRGRKITWNLHSEASSITERWVWSNIRSSKFHWNLTGDTFPRRIGNTYRTVVCLKSACHRVKLRGVYEP